MTKMENVKDAAKAEKAAPKPTGIDLLREPFPEHQISKLPKQTKKQTEDRANYINCKVCGGWHHKHAIHLDYVGHAALTDRLLDCDPKWNWKPLAFTEAGTPAFDPSGGMWIELTVCGVTRYGYGHADGKRGGDAIKEVIGDALRNAAMRFGAALDLWHKGDLHGLENEPEDNDGKEDGDHPRAKCGDGPSKEAITTATDSLSGAENLNQLKAIWTDLPKPVKSCPAVITAKDTRKRELDRAAKEASPAPKTEIDDKIPV